MTNELTGQKIFFNVRSKKLVAVLEQGTGGSIVGTITDGKVGRGRAVLNTEFHKNYLADDGQPRTSGYVPVEALPEGHPHAVKAKKTNWSSMDIDDLDNLSDAELAELILEQERIKKDAADLADQAKVIAKSRRGNNTGLDIQGDIALVYTSGAKFDAGYARRRLSAEDYKKILLAKPDATLARKIFENEPEKLEACLKDNGPSLTVRRATEDDLEKYARSQPQNDEDFYLA